MVAHLIMPNVPKGTSFATAWRRLLGREPGTVPGQADRRKRLSADQSVELMAMWVRSHGGKDLRPEAARG